MKDIFRSPRLVAATTLLALGLAGCDGALPSRGESSTDADSSHFTKTGPNTQVYNYQPIINGFAKFLKENTDDPSKAGTYRSDGSGASFYVGKTGKNQAKSEIGEIDVRCAGPNNTQLTFTEVGVTLHGEQPNSMTTIFPDLTSTAPIDDGICKDGKLTAADKIETDTAIEFEYYSVDQD